MSAGSDKPTTVADYWRMFGHVLRDPKHPMHAEVSEEARALAIAAAGPNAHRPIGPGGEISGDAPDNGSLYR